MCHTRNGLNAEAKSFLTKKFFFPQKILLLKRCQMEKAVRETLASILSLSSFTRPAKAVHQTYSFIGSVYVVCTLIKDLKDSLPRRQSQGSSRIPPHEHLLNRPLTTVRWRFWKNQFAVTLMLTPLSFATCLIKIFAFEGQNAENKNFSCILYCGAGPGCFIRTICK